MEILQDLLAQLSSEDALQGLLAASLWVTVKRILQVISLLLFAAVVIVAVRLSKLRFDTSPKERVGESVRGSLVASGRIAKQWARIRQRLELPAEAEWKIAVIEADNLVDDILRRMGYPGTSMGERLKAVGPRQLASLEALWAAHKVRNSIVHDPNQALRYRDAREALGNFETFLKEVQYLE